MRAFFVCSSLVLISLCVGCLVRTDGSACDPDAGDAGDCQELNPEADRSDGGDGGVGSPAVDDCTVLLSKACGVANECAADPGCQAASLVTRFEPERCASALSDNRGYPTCAAGSCDELVAKVCGSTNACDADAACEPATVLRERADDGDVSAANSCGQALADELVFPRCAG